MFRSGYDNHPLYSESNMTPLQLWMHGLASYEKEYDPSEEGLASFGDYDGLLPSHEYDDDTWNEISVQIPEIPCHLDDAAFNRVKTAVNPLEDSLSYGVDIYARSLEIVHNLSILSVAN